MNLLLLRLLRLLAVLLLLPTLVAQAAATLTPAQALNRTDSLTITFDATRSDSGLTAWAGDVYAHTGVVIPASTFLAD